MPRGHVHTFTEPKKVPYRQIFMPWVHFFAQNGHVNVLCDRREVVLDHVNVFREHFHVPEGRIQMPGVAVNVTKRRIHRPKTAMDPIFEHE